ncbi:MAG: hypothetical protein ABSH48_27290 [Verrucomicrobiota bacterium]
MQLYRQGFICQVLIPFSPATYIVKVENMLVGAFSQSFHQQSLSVLVKKKPLVQLARRTISCTLAFVTGLHGSGPAERQ